MKDRRPSTSTRPGKQRRTKERIWGNTAEEPISSYRGRESREDNKIACLVCMYIHHRQVALYHIMLLFAAFIPGAEQRRGENNELQLYVAPVCLLRLYCWWWGRDHTARTQGRVGLPSPEAALEGLQRSDPSPSLGSESVSSLLRPSVCSPNDAAAAVGVEKKVKWILILCFVS